MANISQITVNEITYDICDTTTRELFSNAAFQTRPDWVIHEIDFGDTSSNSTLPARDDVDYSYWTITQRRIFNLSNTSNNFLVTQSVVGVANSYGSATGNFFIGHYSYDDENTIAPTKPPGWWEKRMFGINTYPILYTSRLFVAAASTRSKMTLELGLLSSIQRASARMKLTMLVLTKDNVTVGAVSSSGACHTRTITLSS